MLSLDQVISYFPPLSGDQKIQCLREYLQYKILKSIFASPYGDKLRFIGGTALRVVYGNQRFSEDIDFDNTDLTFDEFNNLATHIQKDLSAEGLIVHTRTIQKGAFHCNITIPELLYRNKLSPMKTQIVLIQVDTVAQGYSCPPVPKVLTKFDVQTPILTYKPSLLLAHKLYACFERKRLKGRDFFDIIFLLGHTTTPEYGYLDQKLGIKSAKELKAYMLEKCKGVDFKQLADDVAPFLFQPTNQSVRFFPQLIEQMER